ncbi:MAG TPA: four helix bundle protein [Cyclobacteriaceae bacterium]
MSTFKSFTEIIAWQKARELSKSIYDLTTKGAFARDFSLKDQINRATGSIMDNIAEGHERGGKNEFVNFLGYSKGSAGETVSQLFRALDRGYITQEQFDTLRDKAEEVSRMISSLISYLNSSNIRGIKFKNRV